MAPGILEVWGGDVWLCGEGRGLTVCAFTIWTLRPHVYTHTHTHAHSHTHCTITHTHTHTLYNHTRTRTHTRTHILRITPRWWAVASMAYTEPIHEVFLCFHWYHLPDSHGHIWRRTTTPIGGCSGVAGLPRGTFLLLLRAL